MALEAIRFFPIQKKQALQTDDVCLDVSAVGGPVKLFACHGLGGNQVWDYDKETLALKHVNSNQCLDRPSPDETDTPGIGPCNNSPSQQWILTDMKWQ